MSSCEIADGSAGPGTAVLSLDEICTTNLLAAPGEITFFFKDLDGRFIRVSKSCAELNNRTPAEMIGLTDLDLTDPAHAGELFAEEQRIIATGEPMIDKREVDRLANTPGTLVETSKFPLRGDDGAIIGTFGYSRDVTRWALAEQKVARMATASAQAHSRLMQVESQLRDVLNGSTDAIAKYDGELRYEYLNPAGLQLRNATLEELIGRTDRQAGMAPDLLEAWERALYGVMATGEAGDLEFSRRNATSGEEEWFHTTISVNRDATGAVAGALSSTRDISELKRAEQALIHQATHDSLTGLANRYLLMDRLTQALVDLEHEPHPLTLLFVDLDGFKGVNDRFGHEAGDRVLVEVALRLQRIARCQDTVARLGGDEFVILCDHVSAGDRGEETAGRIVRALAVPFEGGDGALHLSASVGAVWTGDPRAGASILLRNADSAMYRAKERGRNRFELFEPSDLAH